MTDAHRRQRHVRIRDRNKQQTQLSKNCIQNLVTLQKLETQCMKIEKKYKLKGQNMLGDFKKIYAKSSKKGLAGKQLSRDYDTYSTLRWRKNVK